MDNLVETMTVETPACFDDEVPEPDSPVPNSGTPAVTLIDARDLDPEESYKLMTGVVVPRPIAWVVSRSVLGVLNLAPFSAFTFVSNKPVMLGINIGRKAGVRKDTAQNILAMREYVVHIADRSLAEPLHASAEEVPPDVSEVQMLGLQTLPGVQVAVPRLVVAPVAMECRLVSVTPYGDTGAEFFVGEVLCWHLREGLLQNGRIDAWALDPLCRLGGPNYAGLGERIALKPLAQTAKTVITGGAG
jgi:flavin reductase (DIM6/NTAB) family NADH-FMN oxidoreductase RutF